MVRKLEHSATEYWVIAVSLYGPPNRPGRRPRSTHLRKSAPICACFFLFGSIRVHSRSGNVNELVSRPLNPDALFRSRIAIPEGFLLAHENPVGTAL
jgi:hypothetical protein